MASGLPHPPFVLIDDAREAGALHARLYRHPVGEVRAERLDEVIPALRALREALGRGMHAAGFLSYEAGYALEPRLAGLDPRRRQGDPPLIWFDLFEGFEEIPAGNVASLFLMGSQAPSSQVRPRIARADYDAGFDRVQEWIRAGDIYQVNYTFPSEVDIGSDPAAFYGALRSRGAGGHGGFVATGAHYLLSFSPELFFTLGADGRLTTRPMKGTALRDPDALRDVAAARTLRADQKQRAENLMIVDLLRNDLSRIAVPGSVMVPDLFTIESYPTVHQMTSTVTAQLRPGLDAIDAIEALFPCGSITGAPKIRAMEIIHAVEAHARGPYTGAIGALAPDGSCSFNVAIRTISVKKGSNAGIIGLGSGLVSDSLAKGEWDECLDKGRFVTDGPRGRGDDGP
jgi:aminodeoxychorismate synthase component I